MTYSPTRLLEVCFEGFGFLDIEIGGGSGRLWSPLLLEPQNHYLLLGKPTLSQHMWVYSSSWPFWGLHWAVLAYRGVRSG